MNTTETDLIFERYTQTKILSEDMNNQYAPEDAPEDDQFGGMEPEEDNESSEGAVNLLEQLKAYAEVPELEDKINQVLEKVFVAVDILKQEPYTDDPQLVKAYASLIEGDF
jgi:Fe-S oxidoreductase